VQRRSAHHDEQPVLAAVAEVAICRYQVLYWLRVAASGMALAGKQDLKRLPDACSE